MEFQDPNDWQLPLSQLSVDPEQLLTSRRRVRDEVESSERCVQPQTEPSIRQFSLPILQLENKALVIVLESEPMLSKSYQMVFEGCFEGARANCHTPETPQPRGVQGNARKPCGETNLA